MIVTNWFDGGLRRIRVRSFGVREGKGYFQMLKVKVIYL